MSELFPPEAVAKPSPRLRWMNRHRVEVHDHGATIEDETGTHERFTVFGSPLNVNYQVEAEGATEDEALASLAKALRVPLWNEEGFKA